MSIICVVYVPEGIVMAAESRLTNTKPSGNVLRKTETIYTLTDNAQKIVLLNKVTVGISFCGAAILDGKTVADYLRIFEIEKITEEDTVKDVAEKLYAYVKQHVNNINFFICGYHNDEPYVYDITTNGLNRSNYINDIKVVRYATSWQGQQEAIGRLLNSQPSTPLNFQLMPLKDAIDFSEFLIDLTIKYERFKDDIQTCGGDIDILVLTKDSGFWHKHKIYK